MNLTLKIVEREAVSLTDLLISMCFGNYKMQFESEKSLLHIYNVTDEAVDKISALFNAHGLSFIPLDKSEDSLQAHNNSISETAQNCPDRNTRRLHESVGKIQTLHSTNIERACAILIETFYTLATEYNLTNLYITRLITLIRQELSLKFYSKESPNVSIGDIVTCNLGIGLREEISGPQVCSLVCSQESTGQLFVLPVVKHVTNNKPCIKLTRGDNVTYSDDYYNGGYILLTRGMYINPLRVNGIVGKASDDLLIQVLFELPHHYDFTHIFTRDIDDDSIPEIDNLDIEASEEVTHVDTMLMSAANENVVEVASENEISTEEVIEENTIKVTKKPSLEELLLQTFPEAFAELKNTSGDDQERIEKFMQAINMPTTRASLLYSFHVGLTIKTPEYLYIADEIFIKYGLFKHSTRTERVKALKKFFNDWVKQYPIIKKYYPNVSLPALLRIFKKHYVIS